MSTPPDPTVVGLTLQATGAAGKQLQDFVVSFLGQPNKTIGTILGEWASEQWKNLKKITDEADLILLKLGGTPEPIPLNIVRPALEAASLQDDEDIQHTWANLLANAADPRQRHRVEPSFVQILRELSPREVKFLDSLYKQGAGVNIRMELKGLENIYVSSSLRKNHQPKTAPHIQIPEPFDEQDRNEFSIMMVVLEKTRILKEEKFDAYLISPYGAAFMSACQTPKP